MAYVKFAIWGRRTVRSFDYAFPARVPPTAGWSARRKTGQITKKRCKQNQDFHKKFQEKEGDAEGLASRQQIKWIGRVHTFMGNSVLKVLDKKSDSHILQIQMEHMDTKPYFKIQGYMVTSLASLAQERASLHQMMVTELQKAKSAAGKDGSYGLVMFDCTNNKKLPALSTVTFTEGICDYTYSLPMDVLVQLINLGRF